MEACLVAVCVRPDGRADEGGSALEVRLGEEGLISERRVREVCSVAES